MPVDTSGVVAMYSTGGWGLRLGLRSPEYLGLKLHQIRPPTAAVIPTQSLSSIIFIFMIFDWDASTELYPVADSRHGVELMWLGEARHSCRSLQGMTMNCTRVSSDAET